MNQKLESPAELHADHRHWKSDISMWQDDIEQWQSQHKAALEQLEQAAELIRQQETVLQDHVNSLEKITTSMEYHEKNLAKSVQDKGDDLDDLLIERHTEQADLFSKQRAAHERIKKHHHTAMAHVAALNASLKAAM